MTHIINQFDPFLIALGKVPHVRFVELMGRNPDIDTATVPETIWPVGGVYSLRTSAAIIEAVSSNASDAVGGTGARSIVVEGLDTDYEEIIEEITLNGTTAVQGTRLFFRINNAYVKTVGSGGINAGNISIRDNGAGTIREYLVAGRGHAEQMVYTVPAHNTLLLSEWYATARDASGVSSADIDFMERHNAIGGALHVAWSLVVDKIFVSPSCVPHPFPEKTDIEMRAVAVDANNTVVAFHGHGVLFDENSI